MKSDYILVATLQFVRNWVDDMLTLDSSSVTPETKIIAGLGLDRTLQHLLYLHLAMQFKVEFAEGDDAVWHHERTVRNLAELLTNLGARPQLPGGN